MIYSFIRFRLSSLVKWLNSYFYIFLDITQSTIASLKKLTKYDYSYWNVATKSIIWMYNVLIVRLRHDHETSHMRVDQADHCTTKVIVFKILWCSNSFQNLTYLIQLLNRGIPQDLHQILIIFKICCCIMKYSKLNYNDSNMYYLFETLR